MKNTPQRLKTQDSDLIDSLSIKEDSNFKENQVEYQNNLKIRNVELQQLRQKSINTPTLLINTQFQQSQQISSRRGSQIELNSHLPSQKTYLGLMQTRKIREPLSIKLNDQNQQIKRYESLVNLIQPPTNRNYLNSQFDQTTRNKDNINFNTQQVQIQQLIKTLGSKRY